MITTWAIEGLICAGKVRVHGRRLTSQSTLCECLEQNRFNMVVYEEVVAELRDSFYKDPQTCF